MGHGIKWTDEEKAQLKTQYGVYRDAGMSQEAALIKAQEDMLDKSRRRNTKNTTSKLLRDIGVPPERPRAVIEKSVKAKKANKPNGVKAYVAQRKVESKVVEPELPSLESALSTLISVIAHEVVGAVGLQLMATVKESGEQATAQMMREFRQKMAGLKMPAAKPAPVEHELTPRQSVQHITIKAADVLPENISKVSMAPKDRKPKVIIFGLIRQQVMEIKAEFGTICDLTFVQSNDTVRDEVRGKDLAFIMTRFSKHQAEQICQRVGVPFYRITGGVSHLRLEMRKWINGEIALAEVEA
jgi:hypothetical protein